MAQFKNDTSQQWRMFKDKMARVGVMLGGISGISVIVAIVLIFFYLVFVVWPLFETPSSALAITPRTSVNM